MKTLEQVVEEHPTLTYGGFWGPWMQKHDDRQASRQRLAEAQDEFQFTVDWLQRSLRPTKHVGRYASGSYGLKHIVEKEHPDGYVSNGVLIAAALALGYPWQQNGINAWIGVYRKDVKAAEQHAESARLARSR